MPVWHVNASQPGGQNFVNLFLQYGVALIGPGDPGAWPDFVAPENAPGSQTIVEQFAIGPDIGDTILLRAGTLSIIHAVGLVASGYKYLNQFGNVHGWDLQHARRVRWNAHQHSFGHRVFFPVRFSAVQNPDVIAYANGFIQNPPIDWQNDPLPALPPNNPQLPIRS